jgi:hypothetical protein
MILTLPGSRFLAASIFKSRVLIGGSLRNEMDDSVFETLRGINRKPFHEIWKKAQNGELQGLNEEEQRRSGKAANR